MQVLQMKDFNQREISRYLEACSEPKRMNEQMPYRGHFGFFNSYGELLTSGYVAFDEHRSVRAWTKKEAIRKYNERIIKQ